MSHEVKVTIIKPGQRRKTITARAPTTTLLEHRIAFLSVNNLNGFQKDEDPEDPEIINSFFSLFYAIRVSETFTKQELNAWVKKLYELTQRNKDLITCPYAAKVTIFRTLGFETRGEFEKAYVKSTPSREGFWVNPKYMHPMSAFKLEQPLVETDQNTVALVSRCDEGFANKTKLTFYPTVSWVDITIAAFNLSSSSSISKDKARRIASKMSSGTLHVLQHREVLNLVARFLGYDNWNDAVEKNTDDHICALRNCEFYSLFLEEFEFLNPRSNKES